MNVLDLNPIDYAIVKYLLANGWQKEKAVVATLCNDLGFTEIAMYTSIANMLNSRLLYRNIDGRLHPNQICSHVELKCDSLNYEPMVRFQTVSIEVKEDSNVVYFKEYSIEPVNFVVDTNVLHNLRSQLISDSKAKVKEANHLSLELHIHRLMNELIGEIGDYYPINQEFKKKLDWGCVAIKLNNKVEE